VPDAAMRLSLCRLTTFFLQDPTKTTTIVYTKMSRFPHNVPPLSRVYAYQYGTRIRWGRDKIFMRKSTQSSTP
jgi:hypothetical protein